MRRFVSAKGALGERLTAAVGNSPLITPSYNAKEAAFTAVTDNSRAVATLIIAIEHK
jgi:hypothetical protein